MNEECIESFDCANGDHSDACPVKPPHEPLSHDNRMAILKTITGGFGLQCGWAQLLWDEMERQEQIAATAIAALKTCWREYWWMDDEHRGMTVAAFCQMRGITPEQFKEWGIDQ